MVAAILAQFYERVVGPLPAIIRPPSTPAGSLFDLGAVQPAPCTGLDDDARITRPAPLTAAVDAAVPAASIPAGPGGAAVEGGPVDPATADGEPRAKNEAAANARRSGSGSILKHPEGMLNGETAGPGVGLPAGKALKPVDPFDHVDPTAPKTVLELLGKSIEGPFGLGDGEGEVLLSSQPKVFADWMKGTGKTPEGANVNPALAWLDSMHLELPLLVKLLSGGAGGVGGNGESVLGADGDEATDATKEASTAEGFTLGTIAASLDVLGAGLGSKDHAVVLGTLRLLSATARGLGAVGANSDEPGLEYARQWLTAVGGPTVVLTELLCNSGRVSAHADIRVGDAKAAAEAAAAAAADAAEGFAPDYEEEPEAVGGAHFSLGYRPREETEDTDDSERRAATAAAVAECVERFCRRRHLHVFLLEHLRIGADARTNPKRYIDALSVLVPALLARGPGPRRILAAEQTPSAMLLEALRCAEGPADLREASLTLLTTLWSAFPDEIEVRGEDCRQAVSVLKRAARDPEPATQIHALACMFQLMHAFINAANAFSPVVYKTIVFMFIEHMRNNAVRDFITAELKIALDAHSNIPVGILVDPVVKQASPGGQHPGVKRVDFELMASMAEHARLEARPALHLLALCLRSALDYRGAGVNPNPPEDRGIALKAATRLTARLKGEEAAEEALERAAGGALARIAAGAEGDRATDPVFAETQRAAAEVLLCTAHSMASVGGPGVDHLRGIIRKAASSYAARHGASHPDLESALEVLGPRPAGGDGDGDEEYFARRRVQPEDKLAPNTRPPPLPPAEGVGALPRASHLMPPHQITTARSVPRAASAGNDSLQTEVLEEGDVAGGPAPQPIVQPVGSPLNPPPPIAESGEGGGEGVSNSEPEPPPSFNKPKKPRPVHDKPWLAKPTPLKRKGSDYVAGLRGAEQAAAMDKATKLRLQREKREEEIKQIAIKRAEKEKKLQEAKDAEVREKQKMMAKLKKKREDLAAAAAAHGRGSAFATLSSPNKGSGGLGSTSPRPGGHGGSSAAAAAAMLPPFAQELVLETLNERLKANPDAELPEGYERVAKPGPRNESFDVAKEVLEGLLEATGVVGPSTGVEEEEPRSVIYVARLTAAAKAAAKAEQAAARRVPKASVKAPPGMLKDTGPGPGAYGDNKLPAIKRTRKKVSSRRGSLDSTTSGDISPTSPLLPAIEPTGPPKDYPDTSDGYAEYAIDELVLPKVYANVGRGGGRGGRRGSTGMMNSTGTRRGVSSGDAKGYFAMKKQQEKEQKEKEEAAAKKKAALERKRHKERAEKLKKEVEANREKKLAKEEAKKKAIEEEKAKEAAEAKAKREKEEKRREAQRKKVAELEQKRRAEKVKAELEAEQKKAEEEERKRKANKKVADKTKRDKEKAEAEAAERKAAEAKAAELKAAADAAAAEKARAEKAKTVPKSEAEEAPAEANGESAEPEAAPALEEEAPADDAAPAEEPPAGGAESAEEPPAGQAEPEEENPAEEA